MAGWTGTRSAIRTGGLACLASAGLPTDALSRLVTHDARTDEETLRRRGAHTPAPAGVPVPDAT
ncbi:hypothetical protein [Streptomyces diastaticus]|uniref:hypothetical protein n=1 Tax=Streptomyces diastaticus TaxID=1956 RepID=UPI003D17B1BB